MRKQYHFWPGQKGLDAWDVDRLIELTKELPVFDLAIDSIDEINTTYWYEAGGSTKPTVASIAEHARYINEADLAYPIILAASGRVMDGMHRVAKALLQGHKTLKAVQFSQTPPPDYTNCSPVDLPYDRP